MVPDVLALAQAAARGAALPAGVLEDRATAFRRVYEESLWSKGESRSGPGSTQEHARGALIAVRAVLQKTQARTLLDVGCGDLNWLGPLVAEHAERAAAGGEAVRFAAVDIVDTAFAEAAQRYPSCSFAVIDVVTAVPPQADVVLCRQCLNHMSASDALSAIANIRASGAAYLLASHYPDAHNDAAATAAGITYRQHNLAASPFDAAMPGPPLETFEDEYDAQQAATPMCLALWRL
jgi:SAM-dependent methyltransferase